MRAIRLATWNVHGFVGIDGVRDVDRTAGVIAALSAQIVALQEVDCRDCSADGGDRLLRVAEVTGLHVAFGPARHRHRGGFGNALLSRWPLSNVSHLDVSVGRSEPRAILGADALVDGRRLRVLVTHFGLRASERFRQLELLLALIDQAGGAPVVLMGDFNEWRRRAPTIARLDAALGKAPHIRSFPSRLPLLALDRIWAHPAHALRDVSACSWRAAALASDHLPVTATFELPD